MRQRPESYPQARIGQLPQATIHNFCKLGRILERSTFPLHENGQSFAVINSIVYDTQSAGGMLLLSRRLAGQRQGRMRYFFIGHAFQRSMTRYFLPFVISSLGSR